MPDTAKSITDLTPAQTDAILRDPNVPADVRANVATNYNLQRYLETVEFNEAADGFYETRPRTEEAPVPVVEPAPPVTEPAPTGDVSTGDVPPGEVPPATGDQV